MKIIYLRLTPEQNEDLTKLMKNEGYFSKTDFIRFLITFFKFFREHLASPPKEKTPRGYAQYWRNIARKYDDEG